MSTAQKQPAPKKLNATQRVEQLEQAMVSIFHTVNAMASDLLATKGDIRLLDNKLNATIGLINGSLPLTNDNLAAAMTKNNVDALAAVVKQYVDLGIFVPVEEVPSTLTEGFIAVKETTADGKVVTPRRQMLLTEMDLPVSEKFIGQKIGSVVDFGEGQNKVEILEAYKIVPQNQEAAPAQEANA